MQACELGCYVCPMHGAPHNAACCAGQCCQAPEQDRVKAIAKVVDKLIQTGKARVKVGARGQLTLVGVDPAAMHGRDDNEVIRQLLRSGSAASRLAIQRSMTPAQLAQLQRS